LCRGPPAARGAWATWSRVFASIASFMGNTEYRGKIIWFLLTARPDLLPVDLKRQGRAGGHLGLFYPTHDGARDELFRIMARKTKVDVGVPSFSALLPADAKNFSGADIEAVLVRTNFKAL